MTQHQDEEGTLERLRAQLLGAQHAVPTSALGRLWHNGRSAARMGAALLRARRGQDFDARAVSVVVRSLGELKGVAMKAGQMLGYVDQSLPDELRAMLSLLQSAAPGTGFAEVAQVVRSSLGARADTLLSGMEQIPIAVASIGQVHRGRLPDGTEVAVKVRHPGIEQALTADFRSAAVGSLLASLGGAATVPALIEEARTAFLEECDFQREARLQAHFGALFADDPVIRVPPVEPAWSAASVLVTRWMPGLGLDAFLAGSPSQSARDEVGAALFRFWVRTLYLQGLFHADPHPGNFALQPDGRVVLYDFGCVRVFDRPVRRAFLRLAAATRADDPDAMADALTALGGRAPLDATGRAMLRRLLRGFFAPLLQAGRRRIAPDEGLDAGQILRDKRALLALRLPGRLLFLFRLRFGLYAVLARLQAEVDWAGLESAWAQQVDEPATESSGRPQR